MVFFFVKCFSVYIELVSPACRVETCNNTTLQNETDKKILFIQECTFAAGKCYLFRNAPFQNTKPSGTEYHHFFYFPSVCTELPGKNTC